MEIMEYSKIIAVSGLPGLYELISSKSDGAVVRSLEDGGTRFVSSRIHNFSHLESIEVYTVRDNVNLVDVLKAMDESEEKLPDEKDNAALQKYFQKVYKDLDFDRVYSSDLKKMVRWLAVLRKNKIEIKLSEPAEEEPAPAAVEEKVPEEQKPAAKKKEPGSGKAEEDAQKKEAKKKAPAKKEDKEPEKKPAKKTDAKKAAPKKKSGK
jgi:hypothetical protein